MPDVTITQILNKLAERLEMEKAEELLALALDQLSLPVQKAYTPAQVVALGAAIADAQRVTLAHSDVPEARQLEAVIAPLIDGIKKDAPHQS